MAKKRSKKETKQLKAQRKDRLRKIGGLTLLLIALFLAIAFVSYLFTWKNDEDLASWNNLFQGVSVNNWLGMLGAATGHQFFKLWMGLPSFVFVALLGWAGYKMLLDLSFKGFWKWAFYLFFGALWLSIALHYLASFTGSGFAFGGAFGQWIVGGLKTFIGVLGAPLFILFTLGTMLVWLLNPSFGMLKMNAPKLNFGGLGKGGSGAATSNVQETVYEVNLPTTPEPIVEPIKAEIETPSPTLEIETPIDNTKVEIDTPKEILDVPPVSGPEIAPPKEGLDLEINNPADTLNEDDVSKLAVENENLRHSEPYDPKRDLSAFEQPILQLLEDYDSSELEIDRAELEANNRQIVETLKNYNIQIEKIKATIGPTVTLYEVVPAAGVRVSKIKKLQDDIALSLSALGIRIIAPIPGKGTVGIEVPNKNRQIVSLKDVLSSDKFRNAKMDLPIALGKTISNEVFVADLAKMPHLLIAGATGQGKSVGINTLLMSLLYKKHPSQVKLVLIDPKKVELSIYSKLEKHFLGFLPDQEEPIVTDTTKVIHTLNSLCIEMDSRYDLLKNAHARNLREYNQKFVDRKLNPEKGHRFLPYIVLVIDEFADLIMTAGKEVEMPIARLAQLARAIGIHLVIATQRPSVKIITGLIKANFPARIAFKVTSSVDSRTIMDTGGAEQLIGKGDMLISAGGKMVRLQCAFVDTPEVDKVIDYISSQRGYAEPFYLPEYTGEETLGDSKLTFSDLDSMYEESAKLVVQAQQGSTSMLQRKLSLGYNRAGRIMDQLEATGIVGGSNGSKAREVFIYDVMELERYLEQLKSKG